jgi:hypothetical protein
MAAKRRKKKLVTIRRPKIRVTSKGVKVTRPTARIGRKAGVNISTKGVSASVRTKHGTVSTRKGCPLKGCPLSVLGLFGAVCALYAFIRLLFPVSG